MAKGIIRLDEPQKRIYLGVSPGTETEYSIQELGSYIKEELQYSPHIDLNAVFKWSGFDLLPLGDRTGVVMIMQDGWTIWVEDQGSQHKVRFSKGVLAATSGFPLGTPVNVTWLLAESTVSSLANAQTLENLDYKVEFQNESTAIGTTYYWNPFSGNNANNGKSKENAVKTFTKAHDLCTNGGDDLIVLATPDVVGTYTVTESLLISKNNIHLRSTGRNMILSPTDNTKPTIEITGSNCELNNMQIQGAGSGTNDNVLVTGDRTYLANLTVIAFTDNGIKLSNNNSNKIFNCKIGVGTNDGILMNDSFFNEIEKCAIVDCGNNGIELTATSLSASDKNILRNCIIHSNAGYQIKVGTLVNEFMIHNDNNIRENGLGRLLDNGTNTIDAELNIKQDILNVAQSVETLSENGGAGNVYYWDPLYGNDLNDGLTELTPKFTFQSIHDNLIIAGNDDIVYLRIPDPNVTHVSMTENVVISKNSVHLRGLGSHTKFRPTTGVAITVSAHHCEISDFEIDHRDIVGTFNGIEHNSGGDLMLKRLIFTNVTGAGFRSNGRNYNELYSCFFEGCATGIQVDNSDDLLIKDTKINKSIGDGIDITSTGVGACDNIHIENCIITHNGGYGVDVGTNVSRVVIDDGCVIAQNTLGRVRDQGDFTVDAEISLRAKEIQELMFNEQEWVSPGLLKIYDKNGKTGGTTLFEFETRDSSGTQTFDITKVRQYIRTK